MDSIVLRNYCMNEYFIIISKCIIRVSECLEQEMKTLLGISQKSEKRVS